MKKELFETTGIRNNPAMHVGFYDPLTNPNVCSVDIMPTGEGGSQPNTADTGTPPDGTNAGDSGQGNNNPSAEGNFDAIFNAQPDETPAPNGSPSASPSQESNQAVPPQNATQIMDNLVGGLNFGDGMSQEQFTEFADGNVQGFNKLLQDHGQNTVRQILPIVAKLLQSTHQNLTSTFQNEMKTQFESMTHNKSVENELTEMFGFQKNPTMQTLAENIYKGALSQTQDDHGKAIEMTKSMLTTMGHHINKSLNIATPPEGQDAAGSQDDFAKLFQDL